MSQTKVKISSPNFSLMMLTKDHQLRPSSNTHGSSTSVLNLLILLSLLALFQTWKPSEPTKSWSKPLLPLLLLNFSQSQRKRISPRSSKLLTRMVMVNSHLRKFLMDMNNTSEKVWRRKISSRCSNQ
jgi:hypothetical protein